MSDLVWLLAQITVAVALGVACGAMLVWALVQGIAVAIDLRQAWRAWREP